MKSCFFIGHREASEEIFPELAAAVERHIVDYGVTEFIVGNYGGFDRMAARTVISAKALHPEISLLLDGETVLPWAKVQRRIAQLIKAEKFYTEEEYDRLDDIDPAAIREQLADHGIVNGEVVDADKLDAAPIVRQAEADAQQISDEEFAREYLIPGESTFEIEGRTFLVDRVNLDSSSVNFQDITFANSTGFPIFRTEPISFVRRYIEQQEADQEIQPVQPEMSTETTAVYPGEKNNL